MIETCQSSIVLIVKTLYCNTMHLLVYSWESRDCSVLQNIQTVSHEAHPPSYLVGTGVLYGGVNRPGHQVNHSPPSQSGWRIATLRISLHSADRHNFTLHSTSAQYLLFKVNKKCCLTPTSDFSHRQCFDMFLTFVLFSEGGSYRGANQVSALSDTSLDISTSERFNLFRPGELGKLSVWLT